MHPVLYYENIGISLFSAVPGLKGALVKLGELGALAIETACTADCISDGAEGSCSRLTRTHMPADPPAVFVDATGAGFV